MLAPVRPRLDNHANMTIFNGDFLDESVLIPAFFPTVLLKEKRTLTYCSSEIFTLANVRELQNVLPLLALAFALSSTPCRKRRRDVRILSFFRVIADPDLGTLHSCCDQSSNSPYKQILKCHSPCRSQKLGGTAKLVFH